MKDNTQTQTVNGAVAPEISWIVDPDPEWGPHERALASLMRTYLEDEWPGGRPRGPQTNLSNTILKYMDEKGLYLARLILARLSGDDPEAFWRRIQGKTGRRTPLPGKAEGLGDLAAMAEEAAK